MAHAIRRHRLMLRERLRSRGGWEAIGGGWIAGMTGAAVLAIAMIALNPVPQGAGTQLDPNTSWLGHKMMGLPFSAGQALFGGSRGGIFAGLVAHFIVGSVWGSLFGLVAHGMSRGKILVAGLVWGLLTWAVMFYAVLPVLGLRELAGTVRPMLALVEHLMFGITVGVWYLLFEGKEHEVERIYHPRRHIHRRVPA